MTDNFESELRFRPFELRARKPHVNSGRRRGHLGPFARPVYPPPRSGWREQKFKIWRGGFVRCLGENGLPHPYRGGVRDAVSGQAKRGPTCGVDCELETTLAEAETRRRSRMAPELAMSEADAAFRSPCQTSPTQDFAATNGMAVLGSSGVAVRPPATCGRAGGNYT